MLNNIISILDNLGFGSQKRAISVQFSNIELNSQIMLQRIDGYHGINDGLSADPPRVAGRGAARGADSPGGFPAAGPCSAWRGWSGRSLAILKVRPAPPKSSTGRRPGARRVRRPRRSSRTAWDVAGAGMLDMGDGTIGVATVMSMTLSVDHRVIDGALGAEFLKAIIEALENPMVMLA